KEGGGLAVVQDPAEAQVPGMPSNALERVSVDYVVSVNALASLLIELTGAPAGDPNLAGEVPLETAEETGPAPGPGEKGLRLEPQGDASAFTCPDCKG